MTAEETCATVEMNRIIIDEVAEAMIRARVLYFLRSFRQAIANPLVVALLFR